MVADERHAWNVDRRREDVTGVVAEAEEGDANLGEDARDGKSDLFGSVVVSHWGHNGRERQTQAQVRM